MENGVRCGRRNLCQGRVRANDIVELLVIDVERLGEKGLFCNTWPEEQLFKRQMVLQVENVHQSDEPWSHWPPREAGHLPTR